MKAPVDTRGPLVDAQRRHGEVMAKLEELKRMEWQPIETAPDATHVLVFLPNYGINVAIQTKHPQGDHWWLRDHSEYCYPTHWMPLPAPPDTLNLIEKESGDGRD